jgi:MoaA/NifB/PqqE/SkfB family radical SAM enzyme
MAKQKAVTLDINSTCRAKCVYCLHQFRNMIKPKMMNLDNFRTILRILVKERYELIYPFLSGEPLLHPDFWTMLSMISNTGIVTDVATRIGFDIDFDKVINCVNSLKAKSYLRITIDAHNQGMQDVITSRIDIEQVYENLAKLADISIKSNGKLGIYVVTVINIFNQHYLKEIRERVKSCKVSNWHKKDMGYYFGYKMNEEDERVISLIAITENSRFKIVDGKIISKKTVCDSFILPAIGPSGEVSICCHDMLYHESEANILEVGSLDAILQSPAYVKKIEDAKKMKLEICRNCN